MFESKRLWKEKYEVKWCELCDVAMIACPCCSSSSCNGSSCAECHEDFVEFHDKVKCCAEDYCTEEEITAYNKVSRIKKIIVESISIGDDKINWNNLNELGYLCKFDISTFNIEISKSSD